MGSKRDARRRARKARAKVDALARNAEAMLLGRTCDSCTYLQNGFVTAPGEGKGGRVVLFCQQKKTGQLLPPVATGNYTHRGVRALPPARTCAHWRERFWAPWNASGAVVSGRYSAQGPNLQNVPRSGKP